MKPTVIDLFCGIGGLGLGAVRAGFDLALSVDNDPRLFGIHKTNFPGYSHSEADVACLTGRVLLTAGQVAPGRLAGLIGGSPCQGFSRLGKRDHLDKRNVLFVHFFRLVSETRPAFFVAENVPGILDPMNSALVEQGLGYVRSNYKVLAPMILNAADFGASTVRKRVFFIGYLASRMNKLLTSDFDRKKWKRRTNVGTALAGLPRKLERDWLSDAQGWQPVRVRRNGAFWRKIQGSRPKGIGNAETVERFDKDGLVSGCIATRHTEAVEIRFSQVPQGGVDQVSRAPRLARNGLCPTLRAGTGSDRGSFQALRPIHFAEARVVTPREAARLQGFPDWFRLDPTKWHTFRGIGNSVSPFVAEAILELLASRLK